MRNHLLLRILKGSSFGDSVESTHFARNWVSLAIGRNSIFKHDGRNYRYSEREGVLTAVLGYFANWEELKTRYTPEVSTDVEFIEKHYLAKRGGDLSTFTEPIDGIFLTVVCDFRLEKLYVFQSIFGYSLPVYYAEGGRQLAISTSLRSILRELTMSRELDKEMALAFLGRSIIQNEKTLVRGVHKLVAHTYLAYDLSTHRLSIRPSTDCLPKLDRATAKRTLVSSIAESITNLAGILKTKMYHATLTRGWDTNMILSQLRITDNQGFKLHSIDGGGQHSEIEAVTKILKLYQIADLRVHSIDVNTMDRLPDMVWRYEGYVFEPGMSLRYCLCDLLLKEKANHIFVGSGADPVLDSDMGPGGNHVNRPCGSSLREFLLYRLKRMVKRGIVGDFWFGYKQESPEQWLCRKLPKPEDKPCYNLEVEYNLKMHELMFNSCEVAGIYPFLNKKTVAAANALREVNHKKAFYKERLSERFGEEISAIIKKTGTVLDADCLFFARKDALSKVLDAPLLQGIVGRERLDRVKRDPVGFRGLIPQMAYICIFDKLFISGSYDHLLNEPGIGISLAELVR